MTTTPFIALELPNFNDSPWHDDVNQNFEIIDAMFFSLFGVTNIKGVYVNSTAVVAGDRYVDTTNGLIYEVVTNFVTEPFPTTFAEDRVANPDKWEVISAAAALEAALEAEASAVAAAASAADAAADAVATAADRVQTGLDVIATAADRVATGLDVAATNADVVTTGANVISTASDASDAADSAAAALVSELAAAASVDEINVAAILDTKLVTAVDVFIYDTSKDSDGGAWRHRMQDKSWYQETLNTATRGSRREFPSVALIVAEANKVTIYDGDDPSLPMWMVFSASTNNIVRNSSVKAVAFENGVLVIAATNSVSSVTLNTVSFPADRSEDFGSGGSYLYNGSVAERNSGKSTILKSPSLAIINTNVNDVAMTVLPDAPIDPATELPVPTIAVATDGGVSVIKDDGTVADWLFTGFGSMRSVELNSSGKIVATGGAGVAWRSWLLYSIPATDTNSFDAAFDENSIPTRPNSNGLSGAIKALSFANENVAFGVGDSTPFGLAVLADNPTTPADGMVAYVTSTYNTGWMVGDIKGAFLSDTDTATLADDGFEYVLDAGQSLYKANGTVSGDLSSIATFARTGTATYVDSTGTLQTAATGVPRTDHHIWDGSAWVNQGLLLESDAATNLLTYSEQFDNAAWAKTGGGAALAPSVTPNAAIAPDGTMTADLVSFDLNGEATTSDRSGIVQTVSISNSTSYVSSFYVKAATPGDIGKTIRISIDGVTFGAQVVLTDSYQRLGQSGTSGSTTANFRIEARGTFTDDEVSVHIWGAQLETGSEATSYIKTEATTATRNAETLTASAANLPYNLTAVSIQMEGTISGAPSTLIDWQADASNLITLSAGASDFTFTQERSGTVDSVTGGSYTSGINVPFNIASRHGATFVNGAVDGTVLTANTTPTALPDLTATDLQITPNFNGTIKLLRIKGSDIGDGGLASYSAGTEPSFVFSDDRSVNDTDLVVHGTITRSLVASGADLVAYSGFSASNYLEGTDASYVDTLYAVGWEQTGGVWEFKHGVVSTAPIDGLTISANVLKIEGTKPKALIRVSATAPTANQLKKIYEEEKYLFQENAKATLFGDTSFVTALAHDPDTNLLHVGTSEGRSVFQGLRRVDNTEDAVTTAIAAVNNLISEQ